jgi:nicotinamidase-related amidase
MTATGHQRKENLMSTTYKAFTPADTTIVLVDHQPGVLAMAGSLPAEVVIRNTATLARLGEELGIPLVVSSTRENLEFLGTNFTEIQAAAPKAYEERIRRGGTLDAFDDPSFVAALAATGRRNLVLAGLLTDVCLFHSAVSAGAAGYNVLIVADACATTTTLGDAVTYDRLRSFGVHAVTTYGILFELFPDLTTENGQRAEAIAAGSVPATSNA